jgi:prevent-host-death family protein
VTLMKEFQAADLSRRIGDVLDAASRGPIAITKHRKPRFVLMTVDEYEAIADRRPQRAYDTNDLPEDLGAALDAALQHDLTDD